MSKLNRQPRLELVVILALRGSCELPEFDFKSFERLLRAVRQTRSELMACIVFLIQAKLERTWPGGAGGDPVVQSALGKTRWDAKGRVARVGDRRVS